MNLKYAGQRIRETLAIAQEPWLAKKQQEIKALEKRIAQAREGFYRGLKDLPLFALALEYAIDNGTRHYDGPIKKKLDAQCEKKYSAMHAQLAALKDQTATAYCREYAAQPLCAPFEAKRVEMMDKLVLGGTPVEELLKDLRKWTPGK